MRGLRVHPVQRAQLRELASLFRDDYLSAIGCGGDYVPICRVLETLDDIGDIELHVEEDDDLPYDHGKAYPRTGVIVLRNSVYEAAERGSPWERGIVAHELAHVLLKHEVQDFSRSAVDPSNHPSYEDSEWQAQALAFELLIDARRITRRTTAQEVAQRFGVTFDAARYQLKTLAKEGLTRHVE